MFRLGDVSPLQSIFAESLSPSDLRALIQDSYGAYASMTSYQMYGFRSYLGASLSHQDRMIRTAGRIAGKLWTVNEHWSRSDLREYSTELKRAEGDVRREIQKQAGLMRGTLSEKEISQVLDLTPSYINLISPKSLPEAHLRKFGIVTKGLIDLAEDTSRTYSPGEEGGEHGIRDAFIREFAVFSGRKFADTEIPEEWNQPYSGRPDSTIDWQNDSLTELIKKADFNLKKIAKAIVIASGLAVVVASAAGKVASIFTINQLLNAVSVKGLFAGATLAVSPDASAKIVEKLFGSSK